MADTRLRQTVRGPAAGPTAAFSQQRIWASPKYGAADLNVSAPAAAAADAPQSQQSGWADQLTPDSCRNPNHLLVGELIDAVGAKFTADTGALDPTKGNLRLRASEAIDSYHAHLQA